jgi:hypothetical protein
LAIYLTIVAWNEITISCVLQAWDKSVYQKDNQTKQTKLKITTETKAKMTIELKQ